MTAEFLIMLFIPLLVGLIAIIYNGNIIRRLDKLETSIEIGLAKCMTADKCKIFHDAHDEIHKREDKDIDSVAEMARLAGETAREALEKVGPR